MIVKLKPEFEDKIKQLMKELDIVGQWYLEPNTESFWEYGSPFEIRKTFYKLYISVFVPDDKIEILKE